MKQVEEKRLYQDLRGAMCAEGFTIPQLARKTGVSVSHINSILSGRIFPRIDLCYDICRVLGKTDEDVTTLFPPHGIRIDRQGCGGAA